MLLIPGGGHNSTIAWNAKSAPFNPVQEFRNEYRCITADLRNAPSGQSSGPLEIDRPWDSYTDDHLGLMDHLGIKRFMVLGFCIGGPFIWNLLKRAPDRIVAAVVSQPSGWRKELPTLTYDSNMKGWGPELVKRRPDITMEMVDHFLTRMYRGASADFVYTVTRDVVRSCQTPVLVMPDDSPPHPVRHRHGIRDARAEVRSGPLPLERYQGQDSPRSTPGTHFPAGASASDGLTATRRC